MLKIEDEMVMDLTLHNKIYYPVCECYRPLAKVRYDAYKKDLVLVKGSIIRLPMPYEVSYENRSLTYRYLSVLQYLFVFYRSDALKDLGNREYLVVGEIREKDPSILATMISGEVRGGWDFFAGVDELTSQLSNKAMT